MAGKFREDLDRYVFMGGHSWFHHLLFEQGLWALAEYRATRWIYEHVRIRGVRGGLLFLCSLWHKWVQVHTGIDLHPLSKIGKGLYIGHFGGIFIAKGVTIGEYCNLNQSVAIGVAGRGENRGVPAIGNRVYVGPGAKVIGRIRIGDDVAIGANAVVTKDLPAKAVAVGVPARVISMDGSADFVHFRGCGSEMPSSRPVDESSIPA